MAVTGGWVAVTVCGAACGEVCRIIGRAGAGIMGRGARSRLERYRPKPQGRADWERRPSSFKRSEPVEVPLRHRSPDDPSIFDGVTHGVGVPQECLPWLPGRAGFGFENQSAETLWVHPDRSARFEHWTAVPPGERIERQGWLVPGTAIFVIGGAAGLRFRAWQWSH